MNNATTCRLCSESFDGPGELLGKAGVRSCPRCAAEYHADRAEDRRYAALSEAWWEWVTKYPDEAGVDTGKVPACAPVFRAYGL